MIYYPGFGTYGPPKWENNVTSEYGEIWDDGGTLNNYTNNQGKDSKSFLKITPSNGAKITIQFSQIKLADDTISIYDADTVNKSKVLARLTSANNGTSPTFVTTGSKMYFIFNSNGSLTDSGYHANYYTTQNPLLPLNKQINIVRNKVSIPSIFVNNNKTIMAKNHTREWFVNDTLQPAFRDKDTMRHTFYNTTAYKVCIVISNCDTTYSNCINSNNSSIAAKYLNDLLIYPNPAAYILHIETINSSSRHLEIVNILGEVLYRNTGFSDEITLDLISFPSGMYFIKAMDKSGNTSTYKITKI